MDKQSPKQRQLITWLWTALAVVLFVYFMVAVAASAVSLHQALLAVAVLAIAFGVITTVWLVPLWANRKRD